MRKTLYTLVVDDYAPAIRELTFPWLKHYAAKIGADFHVITERKYPEMPITFEKFQVGELAKERGDEWSIFLDADTLVNPEMFDPTNHLPKNAVAHNGKDFAGVRWTYDKYLSRDGRNIGSCTWCVIASEWTVEDLWRKPDFVNLHSPEYLSQPNYVRDCVNEIFSKIHITVGEQNSGHCQTEHLIDDYLLSRNIARFGLHFTTLMELCGALGMPPHNPHFWHKYTMSEDDKLREMVAILSTPQGQPAFAENGEFVNHPAGPMLKTPDGRVIKACGVGWQLLARDEAAAFREKWSVK